MKYQGRNFFSSSHRFSPGTFARSLPPQTSHIMQHSTEILPTVDISSSIMVQVHCCLNFYGFVLFLLDFLPQMLAAEDTLPKGSLLLSKYIFPVVTHTLPTSVLWLEKKKCHLQQAGCYFFK